MNALTQRSGSAQETHAPASRLFIAAECQPWQLSRQYLRLFGNTPPDQVMAPAFEHSGLTPDKGLDCNAPPFAPCDPSQAAGHLFAGLAEAGHPSAAALASIATLRARHLEKGHTPAADAAHGPVYFKRKSDNAWRDALLARSPEQRRKLLVIAAAILIAMIDAEDFIASQQEQPAP